VADLCSPKFGNDLADFGAMMARQVATQKIRVTETPDIESIVVTYGLEDQPEVERQQLLRSQLDYRFISDSNEVIINPYLKLKRVEGASVWVTSKPASLGNYKNGRLQSL